MRVRPKFVGAVAVLAASATGIAAARASKLQLQDVAPQQGSVLQSRTRLVTVDVVATDSHGNVVSDLKPEDLEIIDGERQKLARFSFIKGSASKPSSAPGATGVAPTSAKGSYSNQIAADALTASPTVILLDGLNSGGTELLPLRHKMLRLLASLPDKGPVAVLLLDPWVVVVQDFGNDPAQLRSALDATFGESVRETPAVKATVRSLENFEKNYIAKSEEDRASITLDTFAALARYLGGYRGRKNVIWVSATFPVSLAPLVDPTAPGPAKPGETGDALYAAKLKAAADALTDARIAVYPVNALGPESEAFSSAQESGAPRRPDTVSIIVANQIDRETSKRMSVQQTMDALAEGTGGKSCTDANDPSMCVNAAMRDSSSYYELAYNPQSIDWNGAFRSISVKTLRPGVKLSYRRGYYARDLKDDAAAETSQSRLQRICTDILPSTTISIAASAVQSSNSDSFRYRLNISPAALNFSSGDASHNLNVQLSACIFSSAKPNTFRTLSGNVQQSFSGDALQDVRQHGLITFVEVPKSGTARVRLAVVDLDTGRAGTLDVPVRAEDFENLAPQAAIAANLPEVAPPKKGIDRAAALPWVPPHVDSQPKNAADSSATPCVVADVLRQAGARAEELSTNLQNFDAHEEIRFEQTDPQGMVELSMAGKFDYLVDFGEHSGHRINETRTFVPGTGAPNLGSFIDAGLPVFAMIFHPALQSDYDMRCEGLSHWKNTPAWVVYFEQRKGQRPRTVSMGTAKNVYPVAVKGRAWIAADSGQIMHLETNLVNGLAALELRANAVSVDYAPVKFQSQNGEIWLPQSAVVYTEYFKRRTIIEHTFSDFQLFSVQTGQVIATPKSEQKTEQKTAH
jgi:VWFA-related protein